MFIDSTQQYTSKETKKKNVNVHLTLCTVAGQCIHMRSRSLFQVPHTHTHTRTRAPCAIRHIAIPQQRSTRTAVSVRAIARQCVPQHDFYVFNFFVGFSSAALFFSLTTSVIFVYTHRDRMQLHRCVWVCAMCVYGNSDIVQFASLCAREPTDTLRILCLPWKCTCIYGFHAPTYVTLFHLRSLETTKKKI